MSFYLLKLLLLLVEVCWDSLCAVASPLPAKAQGTVLPCTFQARRSWYILLQRWRVFTGGEGTNKAGEPADKAGWS